MSTEEEQMPFERLHAPTVESLNQIFDKYEFKSIIAIGGMGAVYEGVQKSLDRKVAIKILPRRYSRDPLFLEAFTGEAKIIAKLNQEHLIRVYDFGVQEELLYLVMEYMEGDSLENVIRAKPLSADAAAKMILKLCDALAHAHLKGVVHRDIKPANIMVNEIGGLKLVDFGIAKQRGHIPLKEGEIVYGTVGFVAPEVTGSPEQIDVRSDIYAVGVTLCQMVTGYTPEYFASNKIDCKGLLGELYPIVFKCVRTQMVNRYQNVKELSDAISLVLSSKQGEKQVPNNVPITLRRGNVETPIFSKNTEAGQSEIRQKILHQETQGNEGEEVIVGKRYRLSECLKQGSRTMVYLAEDTLMKRPVKIRLFFKSDSASWSSDYQEIITKLSMVEHPNIPKVLDAGFYEAGAFAVYAWGDGKNVTELVGEDLGYQDYYSVANQLLDALEVASHYEFNHNALNILSVIREPRSLGGGRFMLMDVGVSEILELIHVNDADIPRVLLEWSAPEQLEGGSTGERTTIYNFSQMLFTLIVKGHPFVGLSADEIKDALEKGFVADVQKYRSDLPEDFVQWFTKLAEPNIEQRFENLREARKSMPKRPKGLIL